MSSSVYRDDQFNPSKVGMSNRFIFLNEPKRIKRAKKKLDNQYKREVVLRAKRKKELTMRTAWVFIFLVLLTVGVIAQSPRVRPQK